MYICVCFLASCLKNVAVITEGYLNLNSPDEEKEKEKEKNGLKE